jgi:hypothetical protein
VLPERAREFGGEGEHPDDPNRHGLLLKVASDQAASKLKNGYSLHLIPNVQIGLNSL